MKVRLHRFEIPLLHPFTIARGTKTSTRSLVVEIEHEGVQGFGEATEHPYYGTTFDSISESIEACRSLIETETFASAEELWTLLSPRLHDTFALAAVDAAAHDLFGKLTSQPTYEAMGLRWDTIPDSSLTIGIDTIPKMVQKLSEQSNWSSFKIKLGTDHDIEIVEQLRSHTEANFRVDANGGWTAEETLRNTQALKELGVELVEQPLPADSPPEEHFRVFKHSVLPVIADESCLGETDVDRCVGYFHGINVKLSKCGGITPALRMLRRARRLGMKTMIGCMVESTVGISAGAQLLPLLDYADLDGATLLARDIAEGVQVVDGVVTLPRRFGNGVRILPREEENPKS